MYQPLSREFLLRRGYCCNNNCINCPYKNSTSANESNTQEHHIIIKTNYMNYVFDIDGTLTPSRGKMNRQFARLFYHWMSNMIDQGHKVYFITGSDKDKTIEQIGEKIWKKATRAYQSCGNAVYENGKLIRQIDFKLNEALKDLLEEFQQRSNWQLNGKVYDNHIEERIGLINFSTIGRSCTQEDRNKYAEWDKDVLERETFCRILNTAFPELESSVGGQISIDIHPKGKNKAQILDDLEGDITFFGDKCEIGGNDYPIVERLKSLSDRNDTIHKVRNWMDTRDILMEIPVAQSMAPNGNIINQ